MLNTNKQSGILQSNLALQQKLKDRKAFQMFLDKPEHVTCDAPRGHLVKETPIQQFGAMFKDTFQDAKNLGVALKDGKSNDHSLGRMNDLGMKVGGGLIAAALMGKRATTNKKLMEIAGFGTFFSVMSLWPKVAIDLPTKLRFGFNPHQKYVDSQGRKKAFFQDNQYLPWDVWSKEDINKVADKMKVPTDLKDREEFTKEKMRTVALQDNTLWMLTAGFATPLLTSLACNRIEEGMRVPVANLVLLNVARQAKNNEASVAKLVQSAALFGAQDKQMQAIVDSLRKGTMPENIVDELGEIFNLTKVVKNGAFKDKLAGTCGGKGAAKDLVDKIFTKTFVFEDSALLKHITEGATEEEAKEALEALKGAKDSTLENVIKGIQGNRAATSLGDQPEWVKKLVGLMEDDEQLASFEKQAFGYDKDTLKRGADILEDIYSSGVKPAQAQMRLFARYSKSLEHVSGEKYNMTTRALVKALGLSGKDIQTIRNSSEASASNTIQELISKKLVEIAGDETKSSKFIKRLNREINKIDKGAGEGASKGKIAQKLGEITEAVTALFKKGFRFKGDTNEALKGTEMGRILQDGGLSELKLTAAKGEITAVNSTIVRIKNALELEKRIQDGTFMEKWNEIAKAHGINLGEAGGEDAVKKLARKIAWDTAYGGMMNKAYMDGNGGEFKTIIESTFPEAAKSAEWCKDTKNLIFGAVSIPYDSLNVAVQGVPQQNSIKFANLGETFTSVVKKQANQMYNDKKWMKVFGGMTIALVGITLVSQLFFGKVKNAELYEKKQDSFESGK